MLLELIFRRGACRYEASDVIVKDDYYYLICDSSWSVFRIRKEVRGAGGAHALSGVQKMGWSDGHRCVRQS
jgi:hypothetical protein